MPVRSQLSTAKAEETRERILTAALTLFREHGFEKTTMRDIAAAAGVATGAAYYYFRSKEELVMAFYLRTAEEMRVVLPQELVKTNDLKRRLARIIHLKFEQFAEHRAFLGALFRSAVDPASPLSPFGDETSAIREESEAWFGQALDGASTSAPKELVPYLPRLLWLYQMGLILFWIYDRSHGQKRTAALVDGTLDLIVKSIRIAGLPLMGPLRRRAVHLLKELDV
ncbi:MAG TPA: TetR family transcriptional regulator [Thermoanaerobaculia bacterium]|nr:TetR family transcriptional regulator [Thermoanaerobaculia bacterium]